MEKQYKEPSESDSRAFYSIWPCGQVSKIKTYKNEQIILVLKIYKNDYLTIILC